MSRAAPCLLQWATLAATLALGCSPREDVVNRQAIPARSEPPAASATPDAGKLDAGALDAGAPDASALDAGSPDAAQVDDAPAGPTPLASGQIALAYACDEKYESDGCKPRSRAYAKWLASAELTPGTARLVAIEDGGPMGAEWNPSNDVVLFAAASDAPSEVRVGGKSFSGKAAGAGRIAFRVPLRAWRGVERALRPADGFGKPPDRRTVKVVRLDLELGSSGGKRPVFFLTAYGE
jgi:hypothetical protein